MKNLNYLTEAISIINSDFFNNSSMSALIFKNDNNFTIEDVSKNIKDVLGYDKKSFLSQKFNFKELIHKDDLVLFLEDLNKNLNSKIDTFQHTPYKVLTSSNSYQLVDSKVSFLFDSENNISHFTYYISKNYSLEASLNNEKLKIILQNIPDLVWIKDVEGKYITCNKKFERLYSHTEEEIVGKTDYEFVSQDVADFFRANDLAAMNSDIPLNNEEELLFSDDGHKEFTYTTKAKILKPDGSILGILGIGKDITNLKKTQKELIKQKEELKAVFDNSLDGLAILDLEGRFLDYNEAYLNMLGYSREELIGKTCLDLSVVEDIRAEEKALEQVITTGILKDHEKKCMSKNGKVITINLSAVLLSDNRRILLSTKDITDSKLLETQSKLASMGEMIGNIAHQWRQPLSVISTIASGSSLEIQMDIFNKSEFQSNMNIIVEQAQYLSKTIDDFKNFVKEDESKRTFKLNELIDKVYSIMKAAFKANEIEFILENIDDDFEIYGYENEFIQALINILNNSKDALKDKINLDKKVVKISFRKENNKSILQILDNGGGIDKSIINRVIEPYFTTKHKSQGTGIGLSITYKILKDHHEADLLVSNKSFELEGKSYFGACFEIVFKN